MRSVMTPCVSLLVGERRHAAAFVAAAAWPTRRPPAAVVTTTTTSRARWHWVHRPRRYTISLRARATSSDASAPSSPPVSLSELSVQQHARLSRLCELLLERNQQFNLTGMRTPEEVRTKLVDESLALLSVIPPEATVGTTTPPRLLDVGSGAGFPGLVLAIARPTWPVTLLEATRKKCDWLDEAAAALALSNVRVLWGRAEEWAAATRPDSRRECFDIVTARAVAELRTLAEYTLPFVRVGGWVLAPKQRPRPVESWPEWERALPAIDKLGGRTHAVLRMPVASDEDAALADEMPSERVTVVLTKHAATPAQYPRAPGRPAKRPL
ncbi:hypothetical protein CDCA_CDCA18G4613 [Cyanidium caldarium]|uniref:Uncharacterized protein n=1 Tax=Cyanidium caldarium TaxID=2771 RepID=A0AAV9J1V7_CYACA|nr:hypothetical protein CDCA_CDCA18G4613 [Cyanidium caldarium]